MPEVCIVSSIFAYEAGWSAWKYNLGKCRMPVYVFTNVDWYANYKSTSDNMEGNREGCRMKIHAHIYTTILCEFNGGENSRNSQPKQNSNNNDSYTYQFHGSECSYVRSFYVSTSEKEKMCTSLEMKEWSNIFQNVNLFLYKIDIKWISPSLGHKFLITWSLRIEREHTVAATSIEHLARIIFSANRFTRHGWDFSISIAGLNNKIGWKLTSLN